MAAHMREKKGLQVYQTVKLKFDTDIAILIKCGSSHIHTHQNLGSETAITVA